MAKTKKTEPGQLERFVDLPEYIASRTNLTKRIARDAIDAGYVKVGKDKAETYRQPVSVLDGTVTLEFPKVELKPQRERVEYPRGIRATD